MRLGALLIIIGANMVVGAIAFGFNRAAFECAMAAPGGDCPRTGMAVFTDFMTSADALLYWVIIVAGVLVAWRGIRTRAQTPTPSD